MNKEEYFERVLELHTAFFDVEKDHVFADRRFDGYAEFHSESSQYVLVKRAKLWGANTHEYMFIKLVDHLDENDAQELLDFMKTKALGKISLDPEHMTSYLSLAIIADTADVQAEMLIRKARFRKNFAAGFRGWADLHVALAVISDCRIIANKQGEDLAARLQQGMTENEDLST